MKYGKLLFKDFAKRCEEVFETKEGEEYCDIRVEDDGKVRIGVVEVSPKEKGSNWIYFEYEPDMTERPQALAYLMGERDDFND